MNRTAGSTLTLIVPNLNMYISTLFNEAGLFQRLAAWKEKIDNAHDTDLNLFLFRATSAYISLLRLNGLNDVCVEQYLKYKGELSLKSERIIFWSPTFVELLNEFSPYLSSLRIVQNMILPLIAKDQRLRNSIPSSLADAVKRIDSYGFSNEICSIVEEYWQSSGEEVKSYRDIDQHFYAIVQHSFLQVEPSEKILVYLPDNPQEKSIRRITFNKKRDAIPFFNEAFARLHQFVEDIATSLGFQPTRLKQTVLTEQIGELRPGTKETLGLIMPGTGNSGAVEIGKNERCQLYMRVLQPK